MSVEKELDGIINAYDYLVRGIDQAAKADNTRAYGGIIRAGKGSLVESIAKQIVQISWELTGEPIYRLSIDKRKVVVPINNNYVESIPDATVREHVKEYRQYYHFSVSADLHVYIDGVFSIAVECKAYTENAMIKRVLLDCRLLKQIYPDLDFVLLQLESQLGGDYSELGEITYGSYSTHTLLSFFDIPLQIVTLLQGERQVDKPIHKAEYYKPLTKDSLYKAINLFKELLEKRR